MSRCCRSMPSPRSARASATTASAAWLSGSSVVICEPMCTCAPTGSRPAAPAISRNSAGASSIGTPNLFDLRPVEMCGWLLASMSGLTRSATRARVPCAIGALVDAIELARRFDVDGQQAERHGAIDLRRALADAREDDLIGPEPAAHRDVHLAERVGVGVAAERVQQADDRERRVGLERVVNGVRIAVERARRARGRRRGSRRRRRRSTACRPAAAMSLELRRSRVWEMSREWWRPLLNSKSLARDRVLPRPGRRARRDGMIPGRGRTVSRFTTTCLIPRRFPLMPSTR